MIFTDVTSGIQEHVVSYSNSAVYADFDNDGDYDIVTNNIDEPAFLYENLIDSAAKPFTQINLIGNPKNPAAIGTKVIATGKMERNTMNIGK